MAAAEEKSEQLGGITFQTVQRPDVVGTEPKEPHSFRFFMSVLLLPEDPTHHDLSLVQGHAKQKK